MMLFMICIQEEKCISVNKKNIILPKHLLYENRVDVFIFNQNNR